MIGEFAHSFSQPLHLTAETLPNRLVKSAMTEGLANPYGQPTPDLIRLYDLWSASGAGLLVAGNAAVDAKHLERPGNIILDSPRDGQSLRLFRQWTAAARKHGAGFWMQLSHAGRQTPAIVNRIPKAPSAVPLAIPGKQFGNPVALTEAEIMATIERFAISSALSRDVGFTGVQIHAAHGYLISQFLNPLANQRTDDWGGNPENRARFLMEVVRAIRGRVGTDFTIAVKLNVADFQRGGLAPTHSTQVASWLDDAGVDIIELSGGNYEQPSMFNMSGLEQAEAFDEASKAIETESYFLKYALATQQIVKIPIIVTGGFRSATEIEMAIGSGIAAIGIARPMVVDPQAPTRLLRGENRVYDWNDQMQLGRGWLGGQSPFKLVRAVNGFGSLYWQYQQIRRMGAGLTPDRSLGLVQAIWKEVRAQRAWMAAYRVDRQ